MENPLEKAETLLNRQVSQAVQSAGAVFHRQVQTLLREELASPEMERLLGRVIWRLLRRYGGLLLVGVALLEALQILALKTLLAAPVCGGG